MGPLMNNRAVRLCTYFIQLARLPRPEPVGKTALLRLDLLGDYILFRPYIPFMRDSGQKMTLICHKSVAPLAQYLDGQYFDDIVPVDTELFKSSRDYCWEIMCRLRGLGVQSVLHPIWSRTFTSDIICLACGAPEAIAWKGNSVNQSPVWSRFSGTCYTRCIVSRRPYAFESMRHLEWVNLTSNKHITELLPNTIADYGEDGQYCGAPVLFIGASNSRRCWTAGKNAQLAQYVSGLYNQPILLIGGQDSIEQGSEIAGGVPSGTVRNLVGKTLWPELIGIVNHAPVVMTPDSMAVHLASACRTPCVALADGSRYGRFLPYPEALAPRTRVVYPLDMPELPFVEMAARFPHESGLSVADIEVDQVLSALHEAVGN